MQEGKPGTVLRGLRVAAAMRSRKSARIVVIFAIISVPFCSGYGTYTKKMLEKLCILLYHLMCIL